MRGFGLAGVYFIIRSRRTRMTDSRKSGRNRCLTGESGHPGCSRKPWSERVCKISAKRPISSILQSSCMRMNPILRWIAATLADLETKMTKTTSVVALCTFSLLAGSGSFLAYAQQSPAPRQPMSFFVTSVGMGKGANLGGLAGADAHCQQLATAVGAGGKTWHAYLSTQARPGQSAV